MADGEQLRASYVRAAQYQRRTDVSLVPESRMSEPPQKKLWKGTHRKSTCLSMVIAVTTHSLQLVESAWTVCEAPIGGAKECGWGNAYS